jgi:glycolate oxidase FAD binding subunit
VQDFAEPKELRGAQVALAGDGVVKLGVDSLDFLQNAVRESRSIRHMSPHPFRNAPLPEADELDLRSYRGLIEVHPADQVVVVRAGTGIQDLQTELATHGQGLPWVPGPGEEENLDLVTAIGMNLPHLGMATHGSWREWVLGLTVVQPSGEIVHCGSRAVKNVAGYDVQRLLVGARGTLGIVAEVILRTCPLKALPDVSAVQTAQVDFIQRTLPTEFPSLVAALGDAVVLADPAASVVYGTGEPAEASLGWVLTAGRYAIADRVQAKYWQRAKAEFDPSGKLNPGEVLL